MTQPEAPEELLVPPTGASTTQFVTVRDVKATPTTNSFTVTFTTDAVCMMAMDWWSQNDPSITAGTAVLEGTARSQHSIASGAVPAGDHTGKVMGFSLRMDANDTSGLGIRPVQGTVQLLGARSVAKQNALPTRFSGFSGPFSAAVPALGQQGNWSTYTWSQWNPKGIP